MYWYTFLLSGIAVSDGYGVICEAVEVYGYAVGSADFVLAAVAFADVAVVVPHYSAEFFFEHGVDFAGFGDQLRLVFEQRADGDFNGG